MARHGNKGFPRHNEQANREKRNSRVLKVVRMMDPEDSSLIAGTIRDLWSDDESLPPIQNIPHSHPVFVIDPRVVRKEFKAGWVAHHQYVEAKMDIEARNGDPRQPDFMDAKIGKIAFLGSTSGKRTLAAFVESAQLVAQRKAIYEILSDTGIKGFQRPEYRRPTAPVVVLGKLEQPIRGENSHQTQERIIDAVDVALAIHNAISFRLGPEVVKFVD